eukprot:GILJ01017439.1.p1 GENE.GILJ01017439.1~~GILJ01017439.1.p1  ORF type:complete len:151 (-),score=14.86 GILJ01017439.1:126-578(-)
MSLGKLYKLASAPLTLPLEVARNGNVSAKLLDLARAAVTLPRDAVNDMRSVTSTVGSMVAGDTGRTLADFAMAPFSLPAEIMASVGQNVLDSLQGSRSMSSTGSYESYPMRSHTNMNSKALIVAPESSLSSLPAHTSLATQPHHTSMMAL